MKSINDKNQLVYHRPLAGECYCFTFRQNEVKKQWFVSVTIEMAFGLCRVGAERFLAH